MAPDERTWTNPRTGAWLKAIDAGPDKQIERLMRPHSGKADAHLHLDFVERYEILDGTATIVLDGREIKAGPGETVEVPLGTPHRNPYNETDADLRLRHTVSPGSPFADAFVSSLGHCMETDTVDKQGEFRDLQLFVILRATRAQSYIAGVPIPIQKPVIAVGAWLGRLRGYRPSYG